MTATLKLPILSTGDEYSNNNIFYAMDEFTQYENVNNVEVFMGTPLITDLFSIYLRKKYKMGCIDNNQYKYKNQVKIEMYYEEHAPITHAQINEIVKKNEDIIQAIIQCIQKKEQIIVIPISIRGGTNKRWGHQNLWIYRDKLKQIEHFEPHGDAYYGSNGQKYTNENIRKAMEAIIKEVSDGTHTDIKYVPPNEVCPYFGFQTYESQSKMKKNEILEGGGYCALWSLYFMELVLKNPDMESNEIINQFYNKVNNLTNNEKNDLFRKIARSYSHVINKKIQKYFQGSTKLIQNMTTKEIASNLETINAFYLDEYKKDLNKHLQNTKRFEKMTPMTLKTHRMSSMRKNTQKRIGTLTARSSPTSAFLSKQLTQLYATNEERTANYINKRETVLHGIKTNEEQIKQMKADSVQQKKEVTARILEYESEIKEKEKQLVRENEKWVTGSTSKKQTLKQDISDLQFFIKLAELSLTPTTVVDKKEDELLKTIQHYHAILEKLKQKHETEIQHLDKLIQEKKQKEEQHQKEKVEEQRREEEKEREKIKKKQQEQQMREKEAEKERKLREKEAEKERKLREKEEEKERKLREKEAEKERKLREKEEKEKEKEKKKKQSPKNTTMKEKTTKCPKGTRRNPKTKECE